MMKVLQAQADRLRDDYILTLIPIWFLVPIWIERVTGKNIKKSARNKEQMLKLLHLKS